MTEQTTGKPKKISKTKQLELKIAELETQNKDYMDRLLRFKAEFENYKKRIDKEQSLAVKFASEKVIHRLLPIVDDLDRALSAIADNQEAEKVIEGVKLTHKDIKKLLTEHLVEEITPEGEAFNPLEHEAMLTVNSDEHEEDCIVQVLQKGYKLDGKVIRPARVSICRKS